MLCKAGGQLKADTGIEMTETAAVTVALDAGKAFAEVSVKNNTLQTKLAPRCETARIGKADNGYGIWDGIIPDLEGKRKSTACRNSFPL